MGKPQNLGHLAHLVSYDASNNITLPANLTVTGTITGYATSASLSSYVPTSRTITINGTTFDLTANRSWDITSMIYPAAGIALSTGSAWGTSITNNSANWNTAYGWGNHASAGYLTGITSTQVTTALGFTPVTNARTITINGTAFDLSANRSWTISGSDATKLPLAGGTMTGKIFTVSTGTGTYDTAIEIRETGYVTTSQSAWGYSPSLTFHWGGRYAKRFGMRSDGLFAVDDEPLALRSWVSSQGYITGSYWPAEGGWKPASLSSSTRLIGKTSPDGGEFGLAYSGGQIHAYTDGFFYQNEGQYRVIDSSSIGSQSVNYANSAGSATDSTKLPLTGGTLSGVADFGPNAGNNNGIGILYGSSGYGRIRFYQDSYNNHSTIHSFGNSWGGGYSTGCINIDGSLGVTIGAWNNPDMKINKSGDTYARGYRGSDNVGGTGEASWHPAGAYIGGTMWQYGAMYKNNTAIHDVMDIYNRGWFRNYGDSGVYNQDYGCHFRRNSSSSHGSWEIFGYTKSGYVGLNCQDPQGYNNNLMFENGQGGIYTENGSGWLVYLSRPNDCVGINGSETYDWVRACTNGKHRITNDTWCDATSWAYTFSNISDERLKENIITVDSALDKVLQLRGVYYNWIIDTENRRHIGLIAQETAAVCPEVVNYHDETDTYSVNYSELSGLFIESTKELNQKLIDANTRIELLEAKINQLLNA